jgi:hypothetical protein
MGEYLWNSLRFEYGIIGINEYIFSLSQGLEINPVDTVTHSHLTLHPQKVFGFLILLSSGHTLTGLSCVGYILPIKVLTVSQNMELVFCS